MADRGGSDTAGLGHLQYQSRESDEQIAVIGDAADRQAVVAAGHAAVAYRRGVTADRLTEGTEGTGSRRGRRAAVAVGGGLHAIGGGRRAGRGAERAVGLRAGAERTRADFRRGRGLVEQHLARGRILVVQAAAHRRRAVGRRRRVEARRGGVLAVGVRAAAVGRGTLAERVRRLARGGRIRAFGVRAHVVARIVVVARGLEVAVA